MKITKYIKVLLYWQSKEKRSLDEYMRLIRKGHKLSDGEVIRLKELIDHEKSILN